MAYEYSTKKLKNGRYAAVVTDATEKRVVNYTDRFTTRSKAYNYAKQMAAIWARNTAKET